MFSDVSNKAQKLDDPVQISTITSHAWRQKVDAGKWVIPSRAFTRQVGDDTLVRVTLALR